VWTRARRRCKGDFESTTRIRFFQSLATKYSGETGRNRPAECATRQRLEARSPTIAKAHRLYSSDEPGA
jgi:hypothetical protein